MCMCVHVCMHACAWAVFCAVSFYPVSAACHCCGSTAAHWLSLASRRVLPVRSHQRVVLCLPLHVAHCHAAAQQEAKLLPHGSLGCGMWVGHALCCLALPGSKQFCLQRLQLLTTTVALPGCPNPPHVFADSSIVGGNICCAQVRAASNRCRSPPPHISLL